jgi:hypothetical protein
MRCYWEKRGLLGPTYRLLGHGLTELEIAAVLRVPESTVRCTAWLIHFQNVSCRAELVLQALPLQTMVPLPGACPENGHPAQAA